MKINSGLDMQGNEIKLSAPEYVSELPSTNLFKGRTVMVVIPGVAPNPDTGMLYYYSGTQWILLDQSESFNCFHGTSIQWGLLTDAQKAAYDYVDLTDEEDAYEVVDELEDGNMHPVTSNAVYDAVEGISQFNCFEGTRNDWINIDDIEKAQYDYVNFTDDPVDALEIATVVEDDNPNAVSSEAVYDAIQEVTIPPAALEGLGMRNFAPGQTGCKNIAHRGVYVAPENTVVGMQAAKSYGFEYVEFDVKWSKDGVPIVIHDDTVDRVTDNEYSGNVADFTFEELSAMDVGKYKNPEGTAIYSGTTIPNLNRMLICCRMLALHPYIEIHDTGGTWTAARVKQCVDLVKELHMERDVTWICSQISWLKEVLKEDPSARVGWATSTFNNQTHVNALLELKTPYNQIFLDFGNDDTTVGAQEAVNTAAGLCRANGIPFEVFCSTSGHQGCIDDNWYCTGSTSDRFRRFDQILSSNNTVFNPNWGTGDDMSHPDYSQGDWHEYCASYHRYITNVDRVVDMTLDFIWNGPYENGAADHNQYLIYSPAQNNMARKVTPRHDLYITIMGIKDDAPTTPHWFALIKICGKESPILGQPPGCIFMIYNNAPTGTHFRHSITYAI